MHTTFIGWEQGRFIPGTGFDERKENRKEREWGEMRMDRFKRRVTRDRLWRWFFFVAGLWILSFGVVLTIQANLGVAPWDVLHIGLSRTTSLSIGLWVQLVGLFLVAVTAWLKRRRPEIGTVLNMILVGWFIDGWLILNWIPTTSSLLIRWIYLLAGIGLAGFGAGMYIASRLGAGPRDGLTLVLSERTGWSISRIRTIMEVTVLVIGGVLGGPLSVGTFLSSVLIGPVMHVSIQFWEKRLKTVAGRGVYVESVHQRTVRSDHHDGFGGSLRGGAGVSEADCGTAPTFGTLSGTADCPPAERRPG
jgi:uncharacterized membrane protein YczE